jgi:DNA invertase Pin-like site-specific DNA recombinase
MTQKRRAAIYCRVSTDDQSCERQQRDLKAFAKRAGYQVVGVFEEYASGADDNRPERQKVIELARRREITAVLVTELSRWGRSTKDLVGTLDDLYGWGVSVLTLNGQSFDLSTSNGKLMRNILATLAEFERDLIRERVKSGMAMAKAKGTRSGKAIGRPEGRSFRTKSKIGPVHAYRADGMSIRSIAKFLRISTATVQQLLKEPPASSAAD